MRYNLCGIPCWTDKLRDLLIADAFTDMSISVIEKATKYSIRCHRAVLYSCGGIFTNLLLNCDNDDITTVVLCDVTRDHLQQLITFVYTGCAHFSCQVTANHFRDLITCLGLKIPFDVPQASTPTQPQPQQQQTLQEDPKQLHQELHQSFPQQQQPQQQQPLKHPQLQLQTQQQELKQIHQEPHQSLTKPQEQHQQQPSKTEWATNSKEDAFPGIMTDLLGEVSETLPELAIDSLEEDVSYETIKNCSWSWKEDHFWPTNQSQNARQEPVSTIDTSEILYDFGYLDNIGKISTESFSTSSFSTSSLSNFSTASPSNFSTSSESDDVEMTSLVIFCSTQGIEPSKEEVLLTVKESKKCRTNVLRRSPKCRCLVCNKTFLSRQYLRFHESSFHQKDKALSCKLCNKSFSGEYYLKQHLRRMHSETRPHVCQTCQTGFSVRYDLVVHMRTHESVKAFKCSTCNNTYSTQRALKEHERTHTGERPYECSVCQKRFALPKTLRVHFRQHSGERPYLCPKCGCTFVQNSTLRNHLKTNHGSERGKSEVKQIC